jgi:murein DD-endopeptidase MepM/ murein hydrolase activator NlpD
MTLLLTLISSAITILVMSNHTSIYATNAFPQSRTESAATLPSSLFSTTRSTVESASRSDAESPLLGNDFQELLMVLLLASTLSSMNSSNNGFAGLSDSGQGMFSPMLMQMMNPMAQPTGMARTNLIQQYGSSSVPHMKPIDGVLTQEFSKGHIGIDTGIKSGTPVKSTMDGKVAFAGWNVEGYGNLVVVENGEYKTYYAHLSDFSVKEGDIISAGTKIGLSGNTGNSTGPHLHYEVRVHNKAVDPSKYYGQRIDTDV